MTREEKNRQIRKEAKATAILFAICVAWHVGFGYGLSGVTDAKVFGLPLWWILSTPGLFVVATVGVVFLLKKVFVNFSLDDDDEADNSAGVGASSFGEAADCAASASGDAASEPVTDASASGAPEADAGSVDDGKEAPDEQ